GLVLYEALAGLYPSDDTVPLSQCNAQVSVGLSDVIAKCLSAKAAARYQDAGALAADLWSHLRDLPLGGVKNRSLTERWRKWRRRRPQVLARFGMFAAVLLVAAAAVAFALLLFTHRRGEAENAL